MSAIQHFRGDGTEVDADGRLTAEATRKPRVLARIVEAGEPGIWIKDLYPACPFKARLVEVLWELIAAGLVVTRTYRDRQNRLRTTYHATPLAYARENPR